MNMISLDNIRVEGELKFKSLIDLDLWVSLNEHAVIKLYGLIEYAEEKELHKIAGKKINLSYKCEGEFRPLFAGLIHEVEVSFWGRECHIKIKGISYSYEFDRIKVRRSFQDIHMKFSDMLRIIAGPNRKIIFAWREERELGKPFVQYDETDWEFCKRIAGQLFSVVMPETASITSQIAVGMIHGKQYTIEDNHLSAMHYNFKDARIKRQQYSCWHNGDSVTYTFFSRQNYNLGDILLFENESMSVLTKHLYIKNGQAEIEYRIGSELSMVIEPYNNHKMCGMSLEGTVQWAFKEKVKLLLDIDKGSEMNQEQLYAFDYAPVSGNIMYAIPEAGTKARLYFQGEDESSAIVIDSISERRVFPDDSTKSLVTQENKKIELSSEQILCKSITADTEIRLTDSIGTGMFSIKKIKICAKGNVGFRAGRMVTFNTPLGYNFENNKTGDYINLAGNKILMKADHAVLGGVTHKSGKKPIFTGLESGLSNPMQYATFILGAMPQGIEGNAVEASVISGIPVYTNPTCQYDISDLIFFGRRTER